MYIYFPCEVHARVGGCFIFLQNENHCGIFLTPPRYLLFPLHRELLYSLPGELLCVCPSIWSSKIISWMSFPLPGLGLLELVAVSCFPLCLGELIILHVFQCLTWTLFLLFFCNLVVESVGSHQSTVIETQLCHLLAVWPWQVTAAFYGLLSASVKWR